jgi:hypothetical protein
MAKGTRLYRATVTPTMSSPAGSGALVHDTTVINRALLPQA